VLHPCGEAILHLCCRRTWIRTWKGVGEERSASPWRK